MKKNILVLTLLAFCHFLAAQSLEIISYDSLVMGNATNSDDIAGDAAIRNNSSSDISVLIKRYYDSSNELVDSNAICWQFCFPPNFDVTPDPLIIPAGETNSTDFKGHVYPNQDGVPRSGSITYVFFDENNPNDSVALTMHFQTTENFSVFERDKKVDFRIYPNPARNFFNIEFAEEIKGNLRYELSDVIGNKLQSRPLDSFARTHRIDVGSLAAGYYFISIYRDNKVVTTKRVQVSGQ